MDSPTAARASLLADALPLFRCLLWLRDEDGPRPHDYSGDREIAAKATEYRRTRSDGDDPLNPTPASGPILLKGQPLVWAVAWLNRELPEVPLSPDWREPNGRCAGRDSEARESLHRQSLRVEMAIYKKIPYAKAVERLDSADRTLRERFYRDLLDRFPFLAEEMSGLTPPPPIAAAAAPAAPARKTEGPTIADLAKAICFSTAHTRRILNAAGIKAPLGGAASSYRFSPNEVDSAIAAGPKVTGKSTEDYERAWRRWGNPVASKRQ
jgi:hypothetical protein